MNTKPNPGDEPAYPGVQGQAGYGNDTQVLNTTSGQTDWVRHNQGLTKREAFAMAAMQGLLSDDLNFILEEKETYPSRTAKMAVEYADALIAELNKPKS